LLPFGVWVESHVPERNGARDIPPNRTAGLRSAKGDVGKELTDSAARTFQKVSEGASR